MVAGKREGKEGKHIIIRSKQEEIQGSEEEKRGLIFEEESYLRDFDGGGSCDEAITEELGDNGKETVLVGNLATPQRSKGTA